MGSQKVVSSFWSISNLQTVFFRKRCSITPWNLAANSLRSLWSYQSSVNHEGLEKLLKLHIKTKLDRTCITISVSGLINLPILVFGYWIKLLNLIIKCLWECGCDDSNKLLLSIVKFSTHAYGIFPFLYITAMRIMHFVLSVSL